MAKAKYAGKHCPICGVEFIPGESDIAPHPTERGPKGGKVWVCESHVGGAASNPRQYTRGKGKFKQTAKSVQAQLLHQNILEDIYKSDLAGYEYGLAGPAPTRVYQQVENPFANAGRRTKRGQPNTYAKGKQKGQPRLPRLSAAASCDYSGMSVGTYSKATKSFSGGLVAKAQGGDQGAVAELARRGRGPDGFKMAWKTAKTKKGQRAANNPGMFGYGFGY